MTKNIFPKSSYNIDSDKPNEVAVAISHNAPDKVVIEEVYKKFGGLSGFTAKNLTESMKDLRAQLLLSDNFSDENHKNLFLNTEKIHKNQIYNFGSRPYVFEDVKYFKRIWAVSKDETFAAFNRFSYRLSNNRIRKFRILERPVFHSDRNLSAAKLERKEALENTNSEVISLIQNSILECSNTSRSLYASGCFIKDNHWSILAQENNSYILNALASNALIPLAVAKELVITNKKPEVLQRLALNAVDRELLELIWINTKSKIVHTTVKNNKFSGLK